MKRILLFILIIGIVFPVGEKEEDESGGTVIPQEPQRAEELMNQLIMTRTSEDNTEELKRIRSQFNELMLIQPNLKIKSLIVYEYSSEGGELIFFTDDNDNVLIVYAELLGGTGRYKEEYYYHNDSLFFLHSVRGRYNSPISWETFDMNKTTYYASQYYFHNGSLIIWLDEAGKETPRYSKEFNEKQKSNWETSLELLNRYKTTDWKSIGQKGELEE